MTTIGDNVKEREGKGLIPYARVDNQRRKQIMFRIVTAVEVVRGPASESVTPGSRNGYSLVGKRIVSLAEGPSPSLPVREYNEHAYTEKWTDAMTYSQS